MEAIQIKMFSADKLPQQKRKGKKTVQGKYKSFENYIGNLKFGKLYREFEIWKCRALHRKFSVPVSHMCRILEPKPVYKLT